MIRNGMVNLIFWIYQKKKWLQVDTPEAGRPLLDTLYEKDPVIFYEGALIHEYTLWLGINLDDNTFCGAKMWIGKACKALRQ